MRMIIPILIFVAGCGDTTSPQPSDSSPPQEQPTATPIPEDLTYTIIDKNIVPGIKRSLDIRLNKKVSKDVLKSIAMELKNSDSNSYERTFIGYYLPEMKVNAGYWATTHFNPDLEVRILGPTVEQEKALNQQPVVPSREIIGSWLQDEEPFPGRITIFREDGALFMEKTYRDGTIGKDQMVEKPSNKGRKFMKGKRTDPDHDYYLVDNHGDLQIWSQDVDGTHVLVLTAKKID